MDGEVKISILQWEQIQTELKALREKNADLTDAQKQVKLVLVEKNNSGHYQFNRWTNQNEWVPSTHEVERTEYTGLDDIKNILREEAKDQVQSIIQNLEIKQNELESSIRTLKKNHDDKIRKMKEEYESDVNAHLDNHKEELKNLEAEHAEAIKKKEAMIAELNEELTGKKIQSEIEELKEIIEKQKTDFEKLQLKLEVAEAKLPWWKKKV